MACMFYFALMMFTQLAK